MYTHLDICSKIYEFHCIYKGSPYVIASNSLCYILSNVILNRKASYEQKTVELVEGMTPHTAHVDELAAVPLDELGLKPYESDYKAVLNLCLMQPNQEHQKVTNLKG